MSDLYTEVLVKKQQTGKDKAIKGVLIFFTVLFAASVFLSFFPVSSVPYVLSPLQISAPSFEKAEAEKFLPFPPSAFCDFLFLFIVHAVVRSLFGDVDIMRMGLF